MHIQLNREISHVCKIINKNLWGTNFSFVCKTKGCEEQPHFQSFAGDEFFMIMPLYPFDDTCSLHVIRGSHNRNSNTISKKQMNDNTCSLNIKVGEIFIAHENLLFRDGAAGERFLWNSKCDCNLERSVGPIANMSLYAHLFDCGSIPNPGTKKGIAKKFSKVEQKMINIACSD